MKALLAPDVASGWARARRFAVSPVMIERATACRLAGDWAGACAAASMDVAFELDQVTAQFGVEVAVQLLEDLTVLAPDLMRWHLPRFPMGRDTLDTRTRVVLAGYGDKAGPVLYARTPQTPDGPQRVRLEIGFLDDFRHVQSWVTSRYLWDATQADELRVRCGGGDRAPFFNADGTRAELPATEPDRGDPAAWTEWLTVLQERDGLKAACEAAGIEWDPTPPKRADWLYYNPYGRTREEPLARWPFVLSRLVEEVRRLGGREQATRYAYRFAYEIGLVIDIGWGRPVLRAANREDFETLPELPYVIAHRLPDLDLLLAGRITRDELHPLVRESLFPQAPPPASVRRTVLEPVRVRCQGVWHLITFGEGGISGPHTEQEHRREQALQALGGTVSGCFQARVAWLSGGKLPKRLRMLRKELFGRARHGDTAGVLELLDAGLDPRVRDGDKRTLLHYVHQLDHELLLPRLLEAGLDVEAADHMGFTPLLVAVARGGPEDLVRALLAAGARIDVVAQHNFGIAYWIQYHGRDDLRFLLDEVNRRFPDVGARR